MTSIRLGLIGDNIRASRAPELHEHCGRLTGVDLSYNLFIPPDMKMKFVEVFQWVQKKGLRGINVTLPYKEMVVDRVIVDDPQVARIGSCNTVVFGPGGPKGFNTDYSGFVSAYRAEFGKANPGRVALIGAGGVGKAAAFALVALKAEQIIVIDTDQSKAMGLAQSLHDRTSSQTKVRVGKMIDLARSDGVVNCTPIGMVGYPGSPVPDGAFPQNGWAFDAVYTPIETEFRSQAVGAGAQFLSGYELFLNQGIDAFEIFTGQRPPDLSVLRRALMKSGEG